MKTHQKSSKIKPLIGVTGPTKGGKILWWFIKLGVWLSGGRAKRIFANGSADLSKFDGFIIAGGEDINPKLYNEPSLFERSWYDHPRDNLEQKVIHYALDNLVPILGICRGMQMMNVALGGTLYQEAKDVLENFLPNESLISKIIGRRDVRIKKESKLFSILGGYEQYWVNSIHHQAVSRLGNDLSVVGREENDLVQAIEYQGNHPLFVGVQWHPELMLHAPSARRLFKALIQRV